VRHDLIDQRVNEPHGVGPVVGALINSAITAYVSIGMAPACTTRASLISVAMDDQFPEASMIVKTR